MKRQRRTERIRAVEGEYRAAAAAMTLLEERLQKDPSFGPDKDWGQSDAMALRTNLEITFLIRLFAEFESGLRDAWLNHYGRTTHPPMKDLLAAMAALRSISPQWHDDADAVRAYRNAILHEGGTSVRPITLKEARHCLCRFFSYLPLDW